MCPPISGRHHDGGLLLPGEYDVCAEAFGDSSLLWYDTKTVTCTVKGTQVTGSKSGVWSADSGPYVLTGDVTVPAGDTLQIQPGVRVMTSGNRKFTLQGKLIASGTEQESIRFGPYRRLAPLEDSASPSAWHGIRAADCSLDYCIIEHADTGLWQPPASVRNCLFSHNNMPIRTQADLVAPLMTQKDHRENA